jgi:hemerythrin
MSLIQWKSGFNLGVKMIAEQHQLLVGMINRTGMLMKFCVSIH